MHPSPIIVANWKMNGSLELIEKFKELFDHPIPWIFAPPAIYLQNLSHQYPSLKLAGQNCSPFNNGAFTGDISVHHLKEVGVKYVIVGHSEQRQYHNECDLSVHQKASCVLESGLIPIICIGEPRVIYDSHQTIDYVDRQLSVILNNLWGEYIIAYEPIFAIGTGIVPSCTEIEAVHTAIHNICPTNPILYGGSVTASNIQDILKIPFVDGALIGGASLKFDEYKCILDSIKNHPYT